MDKKELEEGTTLNLQFKKAKGLLPVVVQESKTGDVLMLAYTNKEALHYSIKHKRAAFWSRSRNEVWVKGETSGNKLFIDEIRVDCDQDAVIYKVKLEGEGVCHTKNKHSTHRKSCFYRSLDFDSEKLTFE